MEACKRGTQKQKQRVEEQQLGLTVVLPLLIFSSRRSILFPRGNRRGSSSECLLHYNPNDIYPHDNQFAKAIVYIQKRSLLLIYLLLIRQGVSRLDIEAFIMAVHHEINLKIPTQHLFRANAYKRC